MAAIDASQYDEITIESIDGSKTVDLRLGVVGVDYYEDIFSPTITMKILVATTGGTSVGENLEGLYSGLPLRGGERVSLKILGNSESNQGLDFSNKEDYLYVSSITNVITQAQREVFTLNLVSKEALVNETTRVYEKFPSGSRIDASVEKILKEKLKTSKPVEVDAASNKYGFIGNLRKPFTVLVWLASKAVSGDGKSAGFFFYQTQEGFKFKSIDSLESQEKKKSIIFNQTPDSRGKNTPAGYDIKALDYSKDNRVDVQEKLKMGAFSTRTILFDPFNCYYEVVTPNARQKEGSLKLAGKELPRLNPEFDQTGANKDFSRTTYYLLDKGTLPTGDTTQQISKSTQENFEYKNILNQSIMRYNQLFSLKSTVTIPGDFSLHAGDMVFCDAKQLSENDEEINREYGGLYIIADLCHYISPKETYTKLNLVRDSIGRTGNHTSRNIPL